MKLEKYAIDLLVVKITETTLVVHNPNKEYDSSMDVQLKVQNGHSPFDEEDSTIDILLAGIIGDENPDGEQDEANGGLPFFMRVSLIGRFIVDTKRFKKEFISDWAKSNGAGLLLPYLREHMYGLALRAGFNNFHLPLFKLPVYQLKQDDNKQQ